MNKEILTKNGFNSEGITYAICGDTFPHIESLKLAGAVFNSVLKWHAPQPLDNNKFYYVPLDINKIYVYNKKEQKLILKENGIKYIEEEIEKYYPENYPTYYNSSLKTRLRDLKVKLIGERSFQSRYGLTHVYTFEEEDKKHKFIWYTQNEYSDYFVGDDIILTGTFVDKIFVNGEKLNKINRCILKNVK